MPKAFRNKDYLKKKFRAWFKRVEAQGKWTDFYGEIEEKYQTPQRFYHTFNGHIAFCIRELYRIPREIIENINTLELSLFLHDSEINFMSKDSEESSAQFTEDICRRMNLPEKFAARSAMHVRHTDHLGMPVDHDSHLAIDIDLAILAQDSKTFDEYEKNIRKEYAFVPEDVFKRERARILGNFLKRPSIFITRYFEQKYEERAKANLERSIIQLEK